MMQCIVFDDMGKTWDARSHGLAADLNASISGEALTDYVIRNLGFVFASTAKGSTRIRLRPAVVSQVALSGLLYWLHDQPAGRVMLSFLDTEWSHEVVRSREEAVSRLLAHVQVKDDDRRGDFLIKQRPLHDLPTSSPLRAMLDAWSACEGKYDPERLNSVLQNALNGRFMLVEAHNDSPSLLVKDIGSGFNTDSAYWLSRIRGLRVEDQPDYAYGKWIADLYRQTLGQRAPSLEDVDAVIRWPHRPRVSYRYRRLVVPFDGGRNSTLLLGATVLDTGVDLRVKAN